MSHTSIDLAIIGAPKAGTTSLFTWLAAHPGVQASIPKETLYFIDRDVEWFFWANEASWPTFAEQGWSGLEQFFPEPRDGRLRLEATPANMYFELPRERLAEIQPQPLVIVALRDPAEQIRSAFYFSQNNGAAGAFIDTSLSFSTYVGALLSGELDLGDAIPNEQLRAYFAQTLTYGRYVEWLDAWAEQFPPDRIVAVRFDDICARPREVLGTICQRAELDASFYEDYEFAAQNPTIGRRRGRLDSWGYAVRRKLPEGRTRDFFTQQYKRLRRSGAVGGPTAEETAALVALGEYFAPSNKELAERYDIDVMPWWPAPH